MFGGSGQVVQESAPPFFDEIKETKPDSGGDSERVGEACPKDDLFYFQNIVFKVEDTLFCVPKHGLNVEDSVFGDMFLLPEGRTAEGRSDANPIVLEGVKKADFRGFLKAVYPSAVFKPLSYDEWRGALRLATKWFFKEIRGRAITELSVMIESKDACEKIVLAKDHQVHKWLLAGYTDLASQAAIPSPDLLFSRGLDPVTVAKLHYAMASVLSEASGASHNCPNCGVQCSNTGKTHNCSNCGNRCPTTGAGGDKKTLARKKIEDIFKVELAFME